MDDGKGTTGIDPQPSVGNAPPPAVQVADTVVVKPGGEPPEVMTAAAAKEFDKISYTLKGEDEVGFWGFGVWV
jgi:hypothetical protein